MTQQKQIAPINGVMDSDSGNKYINTAQGIVRERVNMRTNELDGNLLFNKKLKGNKIVNTNIVLPRGMNKCIGWCIDNKTESIFWFIYNGGDSDPIFPLSGALDINGVMTETDIWAKAVKLQYYSSGKTYQDYVNDINIFFGSGHDITLAYNNYIYQFSASAGSIGSYVEWLTGVLSYDQWLESAASCKHSILRYFVKTDIIEKILFAKKGLDFENAYLSACVVDGRIYWVNGSKMPKSFNINRAILYTNTEI